MAPSQASKSAKKVVVAVVIVAVVIVALLLSLSALNAATSNGSGGLFSTQKKATVVVTINSTHILFGVNYRLMLDGVLYDSDYLSANSYRVYTLTHVFSGASDSVNIYADTTGGGTGATSDSRTIVVYADQTYSVTLNI